jgi:hypothetical protein
LREYVGVLSLLTKFQLVFIDRNGLVPTLGIEGTYTEPIATNGPADRPHSVSKDVPQSALVVPDADITRLKSVVSAVPVLGLMVTRIAVALRSTAHKGVLERSQIYKNLPSTEKHESTRSNPHQLDG